MPCRQKLGAVSNGEEPDSYEPQVNLLSERVTKELTQDTATSSASCIYVWFSHLTHILTTKGLNAFTWFLVTGTGLLDVFSVKLNHWKNIQVKNIQVLKQTTNLAA
ncbi:hypothetical protein AMECASPLE_038695 [Ameca splendens]|uniref:Uncharacterized protein n=1 Tax=Ameca splendens TaxID=208324 RepID=A0ABV0XX85_9TELE